MDHPSSDFWLMVNRFLEIRSPWVTILGENLQDDQGKLLEYWRIERDDSVIILTLQAGQFIFPSPLYRPGVQRRTLDFPGGRILANKSPEEMAFTILQRELGISSTEVQTMTPLNSVAWEINSSFSNQKLYGFVAELDPSFAVGSEYLGVTYPDTPEGINQVLQALTCLQCRGLFLEWLRIRTS